MPFSREELHSILSALPDPAFVLTRSGRYAAIFGGSDARYYHDGSSLIGQSLFDVIAHEKARWFTLQVREALDSRALRIVEYSLSGNDVKGLEDSGPDAPIWFEGRIQALDFLVDGEDAVVWIASNITEKNAVEKRLRIQSETCPLTGVFNRRKLLEVLAQHFELFTRNRIPTSVLMFDIDNFKTINDHLGHQVGDHVLVAVADVCRQELRKCDYIARLGGDEFVVLMPATRHDHGIIVADRLRHLISSRLEETFKRICTISGGLTEFSPPDVSYEAVLRRADDGLYRSKRGGRDQVSVV
ncbi:GGDEF domain-containing protein [Ciceribacter naphthalenivorans]|uniref:diguanylate cyclase n=2 Tax=Alphaproteobacteria TaxID=28211 RepID=A0A512HCQ5_9HYPH|nr:GGDEF domain-containing protein [Ciceribacter naphthalenivorans]GLR20358.1 GGDEF domain-containing protein [Ciceribacter naphthalenivorans]GLT03214.1 GGDEF domain-containing protein [Sphingomonas psychrolutea]